MTNADSSSQDPAQDPTQGSGTRSAADSAAHSAALTSPIAVRAGLVLVDQLIRSGVREAVLCPGSRNSPLNLAFVEAERVGRVRLHVRTDERSAAFLALGLAKVSRRPVPVVMTSGTAVANCLPAMVEATLSGVPLVVLSANRPLSMLGSGANQTIDQAEIFGTHSVCTLNTGELALEGAAAGAAGELRDLVRKLINAATDPIDGGGAHLDVPLREPLVPPTLDELSLWAGEIAAAEDAATTEGAHDSHAPSQPTRGPRKLPYGQVEVDLSRRTLVIAGSVSDVAWARSIMDELADVPTVAEPVAPAPDFPVHSAAVDMFSTQVVSDGEHSAVTIPEQIVVIGRPTLHRGVTKLLANKDINVIALSDTRNVTDVFDNVDEVGSTVRPRGEQPESWLQVARAISDMGVNQVRDGLAEREPFTAVHAVAVVADALRDGDLLVLGASTAVRDASRAGLPFDGVQAIANRGAAGIDGTISTAVGAAMAHAHADPTAIRAPRTIAVMGDLTFAHDLGGLNIGPLEPRPDNLLIVLTNDSGGGIFETLEPGAENLRTFADGTAAFERVFGTPLDLDFAELCAGFGVEHKLATSVEELATVIDEHAEIGGSGITVLEVKVSRRGRQEIEKRIAGTR
ncbi:2-succinyl-5-enolpyruvyl-6-hydroxy-3-cyclohexene-1-carboxylic-acid synthase [Corynebacterium jeikeium]|uniref:2-succinyl-5-enolpyruvyl-6-hydroxy-3- cyclohexene-1-carboxylic-acid synthase n=1 Tax=Corynebacterium jeikeium TaxID=38289 RepID=UPI000053F2D4|nr:2-succinyl-5-enolpyruvyl-6-hydroxy-3-cyclohexene-1-carboxylic-acid synthase [Corynebacterium jeikeium]WCZ54525.1 2-succinyl-5-enolpyruvyl-6-hydroxy-3-cyclohexene-1-carboxylate synthase [Corynebacterium jeikeium]CAI38048.1 2-oxoglutarate decarboxylase / 2-succinyl-6-hydroxy-2,4-cyclohexadiene-1-carboxylate synthase [Corynebacterium jeikeium K411]SQI19301.1 2-succinyl-5-enolpyruvyl-6-hydroxy-3-cyclohexene-1-carboxylate synthase [Corynebacterium jeikeium]SUY82373.1 2-succinyl-5-enolpyruvyl-6-hy